RLPARRWGRGAARGRGRVRRERTERNGTERADGASDRVTETQRGTRTRERGWSWRTRLRRYDGGMPGDSPRPVPPWPSGWTGWSRCDGPSPRDAMRWTTAGTAGPPKPFSRQPRGRGPTRTG